MARVFRESEHKEKTPAFTPRFVYGEDSIGLSGLGNRYPNAFVHLGVMKGVIKIVRLRGRRVMSDYLRRRRACVLSPECSP